MPISPSRSLDHRPHRRGRGDRAAGGGDQGIGRERARRRREVDRSHDRSRRPQAHPGRRRRAWAGRSRSRPCRRTARDVEDSRTAISCKSPPSAFAARRCPRSPRCRGSRSAPATPGAPHGLRLLVEDGIKSAIEPCACATGARVEARDLFAATPARLKFLKSDRAEALAAADAVKRLAMAAPHVRFSFVTDLGSGFDWPACGPGEAGFAERLRQALGGDFGSNSVALDANRDGARSPAASACRPTAGRTRPSSSCSSTGGRCATRRSPARCAAPISISCPRTGMRWRLCSSNAIRRKSTSTSILRKPKCASATPRPSAA